MHRLDELLDQLADTDDMDRSVAAISLLEAEAAPEWLPRLYEILGTPDDFYMREAVAPAIIRLEGASALPGLMAALRLGFAEEHDCDSLQSCVCDLVESEPDASSAILLPLAESPDSADRAEAAWLLGYALAAVPPDVIVRLAADESPRVRSSACGSLASLKGHEPAFQMLVQRLDDPDEEVQISAMSSLGYFGDARALPLLIRLQGSVSERGRHMLDDAIRTLRNTVPSVQGTAFPAGGSHRVSAGNSNPDLP